MLFITVNAGAKSGYKRGDLATIGGLKKKNGLQKKGGGLGARHVDPEKPSKKKLWDFAPLKILRQI